ncbi:hypothetical protein GH714_019753 [Hevea brasiliensis]|uniref:Uncharacterized protein n=1 Tax=Hevea brasiliensis TaxID=3981 RepID=A0A6A6N2H7_HEVBR|nr:hypothetical protein GH714_019753 [Hevea brasiliensis]
MASCGILFSSSIFNKGVNIVPQDFVEQLKSVLSDMQVDVVKTGLLPSIDIVKILNQSLRKFPVRGSFGGGPVMVSTSGDVLAGPSILSSFRNILVKGGDLPDSLDAVDIFFDGKDYHELRSPRIKTRNTHGTGCTLASCIAAELAKVAKRYVETALEYSKDIFIGNGRQGPFDHLLRLTNSICSGRQQTFNPSDLFLYAVTDSQMNKKWGRSMVDAIKAAIEGGATIVQLREKDAETREFLDMAKACLEICRSHGVPLLIDDRVDVALACDADGVHVGSVMETGVSNLEGVAVVSALFDKESVLAETRNLHAILTEAASQVK